MSKYVLKRGFVSRRDIINELILWMSETISRDNDYEMNLFNNVVKTFGSNE